VTGVELESSALLIDLENLRGFLLVPLHYLELARNAINGLKEPINLEIISYSIYPTLTSQQYIVATSLDDVLIKLLKSFVDRQDTVCTCMRFLSARVAKRIESVCRVVDAGTCIEAAAAMRSEDDIEKLKQLGQTILRCLDRIISTLRVGSINIGEIITILVQYLGNSLDLRNTSIDIKPHRIQITVCARLVDGIPLRNCIGLSIPVLVQIKDFESLIQSLYVRSLSDIPVQILDVATRIFRNINVTSVHVHGIGIDIHEYPYDIQDLVEAQNLDRITLLITLYANDIAVLRATTYFYSGKLYPLW